MIENTKVICSTCLLSSPFSDDILYCGLDPSANPPEMTIKNRFCKDGMWICGGVVMDFKEAFTHVYGKAGKHPKDLDE